MPEPLGDLVARIASRQAGRSEATLAADIRALLLSGYLDLDQGDIRDVPLEAAVGGGRRIDIEVGFTVIEVKRDLRAANVREQAVLQLTDYVRDRTQAFGQRYVGVLTDGAEWLMFHLTAQGLDEATRLDVTAQTDPDALSAWLEGVLVTRQGVVPTPPEIEGRLGSQSSGHRLDYADLLSLYQASRARPAVALKRNLWAKLLRTAFGTGFTDDEALFVNHTLLVVTAEVIAHAVVGYDVAALEPHTLLSGQRFESAQISGVVEEDFFDWVLDADGGVEFVRALARRLAAFDWAAVEHDVMKVLYESVIAPEQRHDLGEYYTPDWLADQIVARAVTLPLAERVLDPACGSGTFLFHAVRRYLAAAEAAGIADADAIAGVTDHVFGLDLHPVAVTLARVTYLLALGRDRLSAARPALSIPVYLGDSLQWGRRENLLTQGTLTVETDDGQSLFADELRFPERLLEDAGQFDRLVAEFARRAHEREPGSPIPSLDATFRRFAIAPDERATLSETFRAMCELNDSGRDHIWGYYVRNLARPVWLATDQNRVDVLVGNPPWLSYRFMTPSMKQAFRAMSEERELWAGGGLATHQDLSALFVARSVELYLRSDGRFAFVMPHAALTRQQFQGFRQGHYLPSVNVAFTAPTWDLDRVQPVPFPVPSCVVFGQRIDGHGQALPDQREQWSGTLPARNLDWEAAEPHLERVAASGAAAAGAPVSPYHDRFAQGATFVPRVAVIVEDAPAGPLGVGAGRRAVRSARSNLEKRPWKDIETIEDVVEEQFVRPLLLGASVAPFRLLEPVAAIVGWNGQRLLDGDALDDYPGLASWWRKAEQVWLANRSSDAMTLLDRHNFQRGLSGQFPIAPVRLVYSQAGTRLAAARVEHSTAVVDHKLYWATCRSREESRYLEAVLNSGEITERVRPLQSRGQFGPRDFDKYVWNLAIPLFDADDELHRRLVDLATRAETVAAAVDLAGVRFQAARGRVRDALESAGLAAELDSAVALLLD